MACRLPGAPNVGAYWDLLRRGEHSLTPAPAERSQAGKEGGFIPAPYNFDAPFFRVAPGNAPVIDPMHRQALEVAYEALENAGLPLESLAGTRTGVYLGHWTSDYDKALRERCTTVDVRSVTGAQPSMASGRISQIFDLRGPSLTLDSACASSLASIHMAAQSLLCGESTLALAGGINLVLDSVATAGFDRSSMLAKDSRCKFGDEDVDGFVRSDGIGLVVLKRLDQAVQDGDRIWAVLRASALGNDGDSAELFQPSVAGQVGVLELAYQKAGLQPRQVHYVECHGTGTVVGDRVEFESLSQVVGAGRSVEDGPCRLGSAKSNIGHCEAASGVAGFIKACLCVHYGYLPATLHVTRPREFPWLESGLQLQTEPSEWPGAGTELPTAGVSGAGLNGSFAHLIVQGPPVSPPAGADPFALPLLPISARSADSLRNLLVTYTRLLEENPGDFARLAAAAAVRRSHHPHRAVLPAHLNHDVPALGLKGKILAIFPGHGSQWPGMARQIYQSVPAFRRAFEDCAVQLAPFLRNWKLTDLLEWSEDDPHWQEVEVIQPAIFAVQISLARLYQHWGVTFSGTLGHSMGEIAAGVIAGCLTLAEGCRVIALRGRVLAQAGESGALVSVGLSPDQVLAWLEPADRLEVAVHNSPSSCVLAGPREQIDRLIERLQAQEIFARPVRSSFASHSPVMEPLLPQFGNDLGEVVWRQPELEYFSSVAHFSGIGWGTDYWLANLRNPVHFQQALEKAADGYTHVLEISPHPVLMMAMQETLGSNHVFLSSLSRHKADDEALAATLARLYKDGFALGWKRIFAQAESADILPGYPWEHRRYELPEGNRAHQQGASKVPGQPGVLIRGLDLDVEGLGLSHHRVQDTPVVPAAVYLEWIFRLAREIYPDGPVGARNVLIHEGAVVSGDQVSLEFVSGRDGHFAIYSRSQDGSFVRHVSGKLVALGGDPPESRLPQPQPPGLMPAGERYRMFSRLGVQLTGPCQSLSSTWTQAGIVCGQVDSSHPSPSLQLDGCVQMLLLDRRGMVPDQLSIPHWFGSVEFWMSEPSRGRWHVEYDDELRIRDDSGQLLVRMSEIGLKPLRSPWSPTSLVQCLQWQTRNFPAPGGVRSWKCWGGPLECGDFEFAEQPENLIFSVSPLSEEEPADWEQRVLLPFQALLGDPQLRRVCLLTRGLFSGEQAASASLMQGTLWGMLGTFANEFPAVECCRIDLPAEELPVQGWEQLRALLQAEPLAQETLCWRAGQFQAARLRPVEVTPPESAASDTGDSLQLQLARPGDLDSCEWRVRSEESPLAFDQVEVGVAAVGLNFIDVLQALGTYPGGWESQPQLGLECSGTVEKCGSGVTRVKPGQKVMALDFGCFSSRIRVPEKQLFPVPAGWSDQQAATFLIAFVTASFALEKLGGLQARHSVLIHSASGGVGLAAYQLARNLGCTIYVTAGSAAKCAFLRELGAANVVCSRDSDWAEQILRATGGRGVDRVLNTLAHDAWLSSLQLTTAGGVMLDISKRDIDENRWLSLRNLVGGRGLWTVDIAAELRDRPDEVARLAASLLERVEAGELRPLPVRCFAMEDAPQAFRSLSSPDHHGKVALQLDPKAPVRVVPSLARLFRSDRTYLVTGGSGALAAPLMRWLQENGAGIVYAVARGEVDLESRLAGVTYAALDVRNRPAVTGLLQEMQARAPLAGVFHLAGCLRDAAWSDLDQANFREVNGGKVDGALILDEITRQHCPQLEHFMLFSSMTATLGPAGQASYVGANAALDALARHRRQHGQPALSIGWGWWGELGGMVGADRRQRNLQEQGLQPMSLACCLSILERALRSKTCPPAIFACDFSASAWLARNQGELTQTLLEDQPRTDLAQPALPSGTPKPASIAELTAWVHLQLASILGCPAQAIALDRPMREMGLDSLYSLELRNRLERLMGLRLSPSATLNYPTVLRFSAFVAEQTGLTSEAEPSEPNAVAPLPELDEALAALLDEIEGLSEEEIEMQLKQGAGSEP